MIKKLSHSVMIYGFTNGLKSLVPFIMLPILTAYLSAKEYGALSLIESSVLFVLPFVMLNTHGLINIEFYKLDDRKSFSELITNTLIINIISFFLASLLLFIFGGLIARQLNIDVFWIRLLAFFAFLRVVPSIVLVIYQASSKPLKYARFSLAQTILDFSLSYFFVVILAYGLAGRIAGVYGSFFLFSMIGMYILYSQRMIVFQIVLKYTKDILSFGVPLIAHSIGGIVLALSDRYFLSYFFGNEEVGLYSVSYQVSAMMLLASSSINQAWVPMFYKMLQDGEEEKATKMIYILLFLFISIAVIVYFLEPLIYTYFIDPKFKNAQVYSLWLLLGFLFQSLYFLYTNYLFFYKKTKVLSMITFSGAILNLLLNFVLLKIYGAVGVAYATFITWFIYFISVWFASNKIRVNTL